MPDLHGLITRLPFGTRVRLRIARQVDAVGCWLAGRGYCRSAEWLWRVCGIW